VLPTYNEAENIADVLRRARAAVPDAGILVVDDSSPDGTADVAWAAAGEIGNLDILSRPRKSGLGSAYRDGFKWGRARGFDVLIEMDSDFSHDPADLPRLLRGIDDGADLVIGSRYVPGGEVRNWPRRRMVLSRTANGYSRILLGVDIHDITAGYRAYRREVLEKIDLAAVDSKGYCFQIDLTWRTINNGFIVAEVPITFTEREFGQSKMSGSNIREALFKVAEWGIRGRMDRARGVGVTR
jgi:dolichol-phosphate mannosyltransferase